MGVNIKKLLFNIWALPILVGLMLIAKPIDAYALTDWGYSTDGMTYTKETEKYTGGEKTSPITKMRLERVWDDTQSCYMYNVYVSADKIFDSMGISKESDLYTAAGGYVDEVYLEVYTNTKSLHLIRYGGLIDKFSDFYVGRYPLGTSIRFRIDVGGENIDYSIVERQTFTWPIPLPDTIASVHLTVGNLLQAGEPVTTPDVRLTYDNAPCEVIDAFWEKGDSKVRVPESEMIYGGKKFALAVKVKRFEGYSWSNTYVDGYLDNYDKYERADCYDRDTDTITLRFVGVMSLPHNENHSIRYEDMGQGYHRRYCDTCQRWIDEDFKYSEFSHTYSEETGRCICGKLKPKQYIKKLYIDVDDDFLTLESHHTNIYYTKKKDNVVRPSEDSQGVEIGRVRFYAKNSSNYPNTYFFFTEGYNSPRGLGADDYVGSMPGTSYNLEFTVTADTKAGYDLFSSEPKNDYRPELSVEEIYVNGERYPIQGGTSEENNSFRFVISLHQEHHIGLPQEGAIAGKTPYEPITYYKCKRCDKLFEDEDCKKLLKNVDSLILSHDHIYSTYKYNNDATCTQNGTQTAICSVQGCMKPDTIEYPSSSKGHNYSEWKTTKAATETEKGIRECVCTVCGNKKTQEYALAERTTKDDLLITPESVGIGTRLAVNDTVFMYDEDFIFGYLEGNVTWVYTSASGDVKAYTFDRDYEYFTITEEMSHGSVHCEVCNESESEVWVSPEIKFDNVHIFSKYVSLGSGKHKKVCKYCDTIEAGHGSDACFGGTATCTAKAKCSKCKAEYGSLVAHKLKTSTTTKATLTANGKTETKCSVCGKVTKTATIYAAKTVKLSTTKYVYNGKVKKPTVTVKDSKGNTIATSNYTVTYADGRKNVGKYLVKVTFKGNYSGSKKLTFIINPPKTSISAVAGKSKSFAVKWAKKSTQVTGYEIQYSASKTFASGNKTVKIKSPKTVSKTIKNLKAKKTYYVRIRTYKTVNKVNYYSAWSDKKAVKTKN